MTFEALMAKPVFYTMYSLGINLFSSIIYSKWDGIKEKKVLENCVNDSVKSAAMCVGSYRYYRDIINDISDRLKKRIFSDYEGKKFDEVVEECIKAALNDWNEQNLGQVQELTKAFIYFFTKDAINNSTMQKVLTYSYVESIYNEIIKDKEECLKFNDFRQELEKIEKEIITLINKYKKVNHDNYINHIDDCLKQLVLFNNDGDDIFKEIVEYVDENIHSSWKQKCIKVLSEAKTRQLPLANSIDKIIQSIQGIINCEEASKRVETILYKLENKYQKELKKLLDERYNKCMIISGKPGTGKTELLKAIVNLERCKQEIYIIPLDYKLFRNYESKNDIECIIIKEINRYLETTFISLNDIYIYNRDIEKLKVIIEIDDFNKMDYFNHHSINELIGLIERSSGVDDLTWILSVNEFEMYVFDGQQKFISKYVTSIPEKVYSIFGYDYNMGVFNKMHHVGEAILKRYGYHNIQLLSTTEDNICIEELFNPFLAHMVGKQSGEVAEIIVEGLYVDFMTSLIQYFLSSMERIYNDPISRVICLSKHMISKDSVQINSNEIISVTDENFFNTLRSTSLVKYIKEKVNMDEFNPYYLQKETIYELFLNIFWAHRIMTVSGIYEKQYGSDEFNKLIDRLLTLYKEEISMLLLCYYDKKGNSDEFEKWIIEMEKRGLLYIPLIHAKKLSNEGRKKIVDVLMNNLFDLLRKDTYALIYAVKKLPLKNFDKYCLLSRHISFISKYDMDIHFIECFRTITETHSKKKKMFENIKALWMSESSNLNVEMGSICAHHLIYLMGDEAEQMLKDIIEYIKNQRKELMYMYKIIKSKGINNSFWDQFIKEVFFIAIQKRGLAYIFKLFNEENLLFWKDDDEEPFALMYRNGFAIGAGDNLKKYRDNYSSNEAKKYIEEYSKIVNRLVWKPNNKPSISKKAVFAFYLVSNSLVDCSNKNEKLLPEFIEILRVINNRRDMKEFMRDKKEFIDIHLK